jgi:copper homeostasis protein
MLLEIATTDFETTRLAVEGGADRIELCAALSEGGITTSLGILQLCRDKFSLPLYPIIRPRSGDFLYTDAELEVMKKDILFCKQIGMDGVVIGLLLPSGKIDLKRTATLIDLAYPMGVTFHRAFDRCLDPFEALEELIELGCERILTSGQKGTAPAGIDLIAQLQQTADDRIIIMPGSGVRVDNIKELATKTGCKEFHTSLRDVCDSLMEFRHPSFKESKESYQNSSISVWDLKKIKENLSLIKRES